MLISLSFLLYNYKENKKSYFVDYIKNATFDGKLLNYKNIYVGSFEDQKKIDELKLSSNDIDFDTLKNKFTDSIDEVGRPMNIENIIVIDDQSSDHDRAEMHSRFPDFVFVYKKPENKGVSNYLD